ncbi:hypothetical protein BSKO_12705 [Bryopsis sp. KO-2023]|nr:hypothetical protein BSKO_12705 [Bryopsis sp. KO-2023]
MQCNIAGQGLQWRNTHCIVPGRRVCRRPVQAAAKKTSEETAPEKTIGSRVRRSILLGGIPIGLGAAFEIKARPPVPEGFTEQRDDQQTLLGKEYLDRALDLYNSGEYKKAVEEYSKVAAVVPRDYTLCMKSYLGRRDAYKRLGMTKEASADDRREWAWGRGIRWPGWYIATAILVRNQFVDN